MSATASSTVHTMALGLGSLDQRSNATASSSRINSHSGKSLRVRIRSPVIRGDGTASPPVSQRSTASVPSSRRRTEEKRVLPVRMRGLGGSTGTGSSVTGKDVEDMIFQCFTRACESLVYNRKYLDKRRTELIHSVLIKPTFRIYANMSREEGLCRNQTNPLTAIHARARLVVHAHEHLCSCSQFSFHI
jgi:hypothetical protein